MPGAGAPFATLSARHCPGCN